MNLTYELSYSVDRLGGGDGQGNPKKGQNVLIHYTGHLGSPDGPIFDSSHKRNEPFQCTIGVGQVIKGWDEGKGYIHIGQRGRK